MSTSTDNAIPTWEEVQDLISQQAIYSKPLFLDDAFESVTMSTSKVDDAYPLNVHISYVAFDESGYSLTFPMLSFTYIQTDNVYGGSTGIHIQLAGDAQRLIADDVYGEVLVYEYNAWYDNNYKFTVDIIYQINSVTGGVTANFLMYVTQFKSFTQWKYPVLV